MQNAIAILPFPLAPVQPNQAEPAPTSQDFAGSFAAELPELVGDAPFDDPTMIASDQGSSWIVPIVVAPGNLPTGLKAAFVADKVMGDPALSAEASGPKTDEGLVHASAQDDGTIPAREQAPLAAVDAGPIRLLADIAPDHASDGPAAADTISTVPADYPDKSAEAPVAFGKVPADGEARPGSRSAAGLSATMPPASVHAEVPAPHVQGGPTPKGALAATSPHIPRIDNANAPVVEQVAAAKLVALDLDLRLSEAPPVPTKLLVRPVDASPPGPSSPGSTPEGLGPDQLMGVEIPRAQDPEAPKATKVAPVEAKIAPTPTSAAPLSSETPIQEPLTLTSFWERYFANGSEPHPEVKLVPNAVFPTVASPVPGAFGLAPLLQTEQDNLEDVVHSSDDGAAASKSRDGDAVEVAVTAPSTSPSPLPTPFSRLELVPVLKALPWSDVTDDRDEGLDPALSSLSFLSPGSSPASLTSGGGPLSMPVQQVAVQLADVLVRASDQVTELALSPEELGKVRLRMEADAANPDRLLIVINVERPETLDLFRRHAGELAEAIRNAGYSGAQIDFGQQGQGGSGDHRQGQSTAGPDIAADEVAPIQYSPRMIAGATLDLRL